MTDAVIPKESVICSDRHWERTLFRLRVGHTHLTHGYLMNREARPNCEFCNNVDTPLTVKHILTECSALEPIRNRHLGRNRTMKDILLDMNTSNKGPLYKFLTEADILRRI